MFTSLVFVGLLLGQPRTSDVTTYHPVYSELGDHPWDRLHEAFFVRTFTTGETYFHRHSFEVPWRGYFRLSAQEAPWRALRERLDAVDRLPLEKMEQAPAVRRLIFFRDLWTVFESLSQMQSKERGHELRRHLARIMRRLELSEDEIARLPNTLAVIRAKRVFPESSNPARPDQAFLPTMLLGDASEWISLSASEEYARPAPGHTDSVNSRSLFTIHLRWPEGRGAGEELLKNWLTKPAKRELPPGTEMALLRRAVAVDNQGIPHVTNVVESLQLLVTPAEGAKEDARFKFVLDREALLKGEPALVQLDIDSPIDAFSFESTGQWVFRPQTDADGELLVLGRGKGPVGVPSMQHCVACHGQRSTRLHANFSEFPVVPSTNARLAESLVSGKTESTDWQEYLSLRGAR